MRGDFLKAQEKLLRKQKENLEKELAKVAERRGKAKRYLAKFIDFGRKEEECAQEVSTYEEHLVSERNLEKMLGAINRALKKIKKGTYGLCEDCRKPISEARLKANPAASFCLQCAQKPRQRLRRLTFWRRR